MINQFNKESLEKLGIFELRNLAREIGVYSPTIYKKQELISKILSIVNGQETPHIAKTKQGRPPKSINSVNNILDIFIPKSASIDDQREYISDFNNLSRLTAMEINANINYNADNDAYLDKGILEVISEGYGFCYKKGYKSINNDNNFFVSSTIIKNYDLRSGDYLEGFIKKLSEDKPLVMYKIEKINSIDENKFNKDRLKFSRQKAYYPIKKIVLNEDENTVNRRYLNTFLPIGYGQRAIVILPKNVDYSTLIANYLNEIKDESEVCKICMLIDERPEDITEYFDTVKETKIIYTNVGDSVSQSVQKIELGLERAKRKVEEGKDVILIISNLNRLKNLYKKSFIQSSVKSIEQEKINSLSSVKKVLSNARRNENSGTLTIIAIVEENEDQEFILALKEICNMQIVINEKSYLNKDKIWENILKSETRKIHLLLTSKELEFVKQFRADLNESNLEAKTKELENLLLKQTK